MKKTFLVLLSVITLAFLAVRVVADISNPGLLAEGGLPNLGSSVTVNLTVDFDPDNPAMEGSLTKNYGSKVSMASTIGDAPSEYVFAFWIVNGFVRPELPYDHQFVITENMDITAVFKPVGDEVVCFMDSNNKLIKRQYSTTADPFTSADVPSLAAYSKPGYQIAALPWGSAIDFDNITADTIVQLQYIPLETPATYTVAVDNGFGDGIYDFDTVVTAVPDIAPEGQYFSYWSDENDNFVSILPTYSFTVYENIHLVANFDVYPADDFPYATMSDALDLRAGKATFVGQIYLPVGFDLIEYGITLYDDYGEETRYQASNLNPETGEFVMSFPAEWGIYASVYMVYVDPADPTLWQLAYESQDTPLLPIHPIISEYGEGSSNNKWIEIYNPSNLLDIDLSNYELRLYTATSGIISQTVYSAYQLSEILVPGDVFVISNSLANASILALADATSSSVINFNGDDAIAIYSKTSGQIVDVIGNFGTDPGTNWPCGSGATSEFTLYRSIGINQPAATWDTTEWSVLSQDNISKLGYHENQDPSYITWSGSLSIMAGNTAQLTVNYNPLDAIRGVTWSVENNTPTDGEGNVLSVDSNGLVTALEPGTAMVKCTSTATPSLYSGSMITVTAPVYYAVNASAANEAHGTVSASPASVLGGGSSTITITPASGYYTDYITVNDVVTQLDGTNTFTINNITSTQTVVVTFDALNTISVSSNNNDYGTASASPTGVIDGGSTTISFTPASGYTADTITINGGTPIDLGDNTSYVISNISSDQTVLVNFVVDESGESLLYSEDFESMTTWSSYPTVDTTKSFGGINWTIIQTLLSPDASDLTSATSEQGSKMLRLKGASTAYIYTASPISQVSRFSFDAKYYSATHSTAVMKVWKNVNGTGWVEVSTISLTASYTTYSVDINESNVQLKITVGTKSANLDNLEIFTTGSGS